MAIYRVDDSPDGLCEILRMKKRKVVRWDLENDSEYV